MDSNQPLVGIGACLVGQPVRYNGDSKRKNSHIEKLKKHATLKSFCPEIGVGMGVPRETVRLVGDLESIRLVDSNTQSKDFTEPMKAYAAQVIKNNPHIAGYILVKGSPSCGLDRVKRYNEKGNHQGSDAMGVFTAELKKIDPLLPLEEDGRLNDHLLRENFVTRVYAYHDWKKTTLNGISHKELLDFWVRYKYLIMAHHISNYKMIGRLLANHDGLTIDVIADEFIQLFMNALNSMANRKSYANVLEHIRGYLKRDLSSGHKEEISDIIKQYKQGIVPLIVPLTLFRHHFSNHKNTYIDKQVFFTPYPEQLSLRNYI